MNNYQMVPVMGYSVFCDRLEDIKLNGKTLIINTLNAYSYIVAKNDEKFRDALRNSDILVPDGFPVAIASRLLNGRKINKIAGEDIFRYMCKYLNCINGSCFFLGASQDTLNKILLKLRCEYPNIKASSYSPPFKESFTDQENEEILKAVNNFMPDVLFIGMSAPKQEKWADVHKDKIQSKIICSIGAVFDFYAETVKRPSEIWINLNLEWFIRLVREPKRLWKRYIIYSPLFFMDLFLHRRQT